jgi:hypothetical protein
LERDHEANSGEFKRTADLRADGHYHRRHRQEHTSIEFMNRYCC